MNEGYLFRKEKYEVLQCLCQVNWSVPTQLDSKNLRHPVIGKDILRKGY